MILLHATCVVVADAGVLIRAPSGAGKSDLALRLIDDGARLVADDYCEIRAEAGRLIANAPAAIAGKMEVRGFGIAALPFVPRAAIDLVLDLVPAAEIPRLPDITSCSIAGIALSWMMIDPSTASAAAKVRLVLSQLAAVTLRQSASGA